MKFFSIINIESIEKSVIVDSWNDVQKLQKTFSLNGEKTIFKSFRDYQSANTWLQRSKNKIFSGNIEELYENVVYFDAGIFNTGNFECRVTDSHGVSVLNNVMPEQYLNMYQNFSFLNATVNTAELLACCFAMKYAMKNGIKCILGDSLITIFYWLENQCTIEIESTKNIVLYAHKLYTQYIQNGGKVMYVRRHLNRADLRYKKIE